eukprot:CAMPEP_0169087624 /NCGR_PEP_ID=MMETSP1015-20121227/14329_1 /TAXON_ID=342587 /ORGANISM="Karlodinium micrum, Strain CCMP2283" /LENGTH=551 /DNA_ID=CAMNT_0009147863 /DNA_START=13 /DNA_END=1670 /DNA_ORIENTATION=+
MPEILVRLNLPGFHSPDPFHLPNAPSSLSGLACAVLEEIGGFTKEELEGVRNNHDMPLTMLGELCAGQLVALTSDQALDVFFANAGSPRTPAIIEVRSRDHAQQSNIAPMHSPQTVVTEKTPESNGGVVDVSAYRGEGRPVHDIRSSPQMVDAKDQGFSRAPIQVLAPDVVAHPHESVVRTPANHSLVSPKPKSTTSVIQRGSQGMGQYPRQQNSHESRIARPTTATFVAGSESSAQSSPYKSQLYPVQPVQPNMTDLKVNQEMILDPRRHLALLLSMFGSIRRKIHGDDVRRSEARLRRLEEEDEELRFGASVALGRASSPVRSQSPGRVRMAYRIPTIPRPPVPERSANNSKLIPRVAAATTPKTLSRASSASAIGSQNGKTFDPPSRKVSRGFVDQTSPGGDRMNSTVLSHISGSPGQSTSVVVPQDSLSIASDFGQGGPSGASVGDESAYAERADASQMGGQDLRQLVAAHEQRIEFLENMHQQSLRQLRKSREELSVVQQQRFREADKVLRLEQLVSEMQSRRYDVSLNWQEDLARLRAVFEDDED